MDYNNLFIYEDGEIYRRSNPESPVGNLSYDGYLSTSVNGKIEGVHRIVWKMFNGEIPDGLSVDHINGITWDNHIENLRVCTHQQNHFNRGKQANNKSGYKGVCWHKQKGKWVAQIKIEGRNKFLGFFDNPETAYKVYCEKAILHYGEYAKL